MSFETFAFRRISQELLETSRKFTCGKASLDSFFLEESLDFDKHGLTFTTLVFGDGDPCALAYFSLSSDAIKLSGVEKEELGLPFQPHISYFPAVKIARFAVAANRQSEGIGAHLLQLIQGLVFSDHIATRLITLDADNDPRTIEFYKKNGFQESLHTQKLREQQKQKDPETVHMIKDIYIAH